MSLLQRTMLLSAALLAITALHGQQFVESRIADRMKTLRSLSDFERPAAIAEMANEIRSLDPSRQKLSLADSLAQLAVQSDNGEEALQAVAFALGNALSQTPVLAKQNQPPAPYMDLAGLVRYGHVHAELTDPLFARAQQILADNDADVQRADFTLPDLHGQKFTLSQLRGKVVIIHFWNIACIPCRTEMPYLQALYDYLQPQNMTVLAITRDDPLKVTQLTATWKYHTPILLDTDGKASSQFHVTTVPRTFVFDREGKLIGQSISTCSRNQLVQILSQTDLHP